MSPDHGALIQRPDDKEEVIARRLEVYQEQTEPLIGHYATIGLLRAIPGEGELDEVFEQMEAAIKEAQGGVDTRSVVMEEDEVVVEPAMSAPVDDAEGEGFDEDSLAAEDAAAAAELDDEDVEIIEPKVKKPSKRAAAPRKAKPAAPVAKASPAKTTKKGKRKPAKRAPVAVAAPAKAGVKQAKKPQSAKPAKATKSAKPAKAAKKASKPAKKTGLLSWWSASSKPAARGKAAKKGAAAKSAAKRAPLKKAAKRAKVGKTAKASKAAVRKKK